MIYNHLSNLGSSISSLVSSNKKEEMKLNYNDEDMQIIIVKFYHMV